MNHCFTQQARLMGLVSASWQCRAAAVALVMLNMFAPPPSFSGETLRPGKPKQSPKWSSPPNKTRTRSIQPASTLPRSDGEVRQRLAQAAVEAIRQNRATPVSTLQQQLSRHRCDLTAAKPTQARMNSWTKVAALTQQSTLILAGVYQSPSDGAWEVNTSTGFLIASNGTFVTCRHVFLHDEYEAMVAMTGEGRVALVVEVLASDEVEDVVIARIEGEDYPHLTWHGEVQVGQEVGIMSHPQSQFFTFTRGAVTRAFEALEEEHRISMFAVDAEFGPGSSGAPVVDERGRVVGMADSIQLRTPRQGQPSSFNPPMIFRHCRPASAWTSLIQWH